MNIMMTSVSTKLFMNHFHVRLTMNLRGSHTRVQAKTMTIGMTPVIIALKYSVVPVDDTILKSMMKQSSERNTCTLSPTVFTESNIVSSEVGNLS